MSARLIPIHADMKIPALGSWQQKQNAVQGAINVILTRAQLAKTSAELSECRQALLTIEVQASLAGNIVGDIQEQREREH